MHITCQQADLVRMLAHAMQQQHVQPHGQYSNVCVCVGGGGGDLHRVVAWEGRNKDEERHVSETHITRTLV